ncbi:MAG: VWA domain-containing protein [Acidobacteria bacterium]|nr:VWA domain-containing protein [Acidobacteriota bacterium]
MDQLLQLFFKHKWSTFAKGEFSFANRPSWLFMILIAAALGAFIYFIYIRPGYRIQSGSRLALIALRASLLALIFLLLMRPVMVVPQVIPKSTTVAVLADDSRSMQLADEDNRPRIEAVKKLLSPADPLMMGLDEKFRVNLFGFSNSTGRIAEAKSLKAEGRSTDMAGALREAVNETSGNALSAIVVVSDGGSNTAKDLTAELRDLRARNIPVYTVGVGNPDRFKDAELTRITTPRRMLVGSAVSADLLLRSNGYPDSKVTVSVTEDDRALKTQQFDIKGNESQTVTMEFTPTSAGAHRYKFEIKPLDGETTVENNVQESLIEVRDNRPKILYIEGEPRWEYGKMRFSLAKNEKNVVLVSSLRSADGKFYRQGVESGSELTTGFPTTIEELFGYHGLIIGSIEASFFSYEQLKNIELFAARRGGGVLAIGGARSFDAGKYANSPVADLLPVYLNDQIEEPEMQVASNYQAMLTARGRTHPVTRLNEDRNLSAKAWSELPPITVPEVLSNSKPGATTVLEARSTNAPNRVVPLLVEQRYGRGRSMALTTNDTWRWRMEMESKNTSHETFWRQMLRHLVSTTPDQYEVTAERDVYLASEPINIRADINDKKFDAVTDAQVTAVVTKPSGVTAELPLNISYTGETSSYRNEFPTDELGLYRIEMTARRAGAVLGTASSTLLVTERTREFFDAAQNVEMLKRISAETGGKYYPLNQAAEMMDEITMLEGKNSERISKDLWDMPINFLLIVGLAGAEWFLRKRKGLS